MSNQETLPVDSTADRKLRTAVERAVRPLRAGGARKLQIRRELYAHACDAYLTELERGLDADTASALAVKRLGDPDKLSQELQQAVPFVDCVSVIVEGLLRRRPESPRWRHAVWMGVVGALYIGVLLALLATSVAFGAAPEGVSQPGTTMVLFLLMMFGMNLGVGSYFGSRVRDTLAAGGPRRFIRAVAWAVAGGVAIWTIAMLLWIVAAFPGTAWTRQYVVSWSLLALFFQFAVVGVSLLDIRERRELEGEWLRLEID